MESVWFFAVVFLREAEIANPCDYLFVLLQNVKKRFTFLRKTGKFNVWPVKDSGRKFSPGFVTYVT